MGGLSLKQIIGLDLYRAILNETVAEHPMKQLFWECTLRCNLHCRHCGSDCKVSSFAPDMPFADFEKVLVRLKEAYDSHQIMVVVSGGEPLMRGDLAECGRRMYELEYPWGMVTNGRFLTDAKIDELLQCGLRSITVSLDGLEEGHNWLRGDPKSFECASAAIRRLAGERNLGFDVVTCVNSRNFASLPKLKEHLIGLGLKSWRIFTIFPAGRAANDPELMISSEQYRSLMEFIVSTRKEGRIDLSYACEGFLGPYEGQVREHLYNCQAGLSVCGVRIDGSITACTSIRADYDQGNIHKDDIIDVWEHRFQPYRDRSWARTGECESCRYWKWCRGGGMHLRDSDGTLMHCNLHKLLER